ncbi:tyrosine-type recombinase/integrase [Streptomyces sp. NPDC090036]|uniref:tyrosine-type recombinase/integrase n=1 Tax=Streptomyces sp. NPDC090036 TaxID=3365926 RepID=UPI00381FEA1E
MRCSGPSITPACARKRCRFWIARTSTSRGDRSGNSTSGSAKAPAHPGRGRAGYRCSTGSTLSCAGSSTTSAGSSPTHRLLFADESGGSLHRGTIRNRLRYLMELEGRPATDRFSPHALRRACATHNYERGVDLVAIQQLLGHWTVSSTMRYVRPSATFIEDAYRRAVTTTLGELTAEGDSSA